MTLSECRVIFIRKSVSNKVQGDFEERMKEICQ